MTANPARLRKATRTAVAIAAMLVIPIGSTAACNPGNNPPARKITSCYKWEGPVCVDPGKKGTTKPKSPGTNKRKGFINPQDGCRQRRDCNK